MENDKNYFFVGMFVIITAFVCILFAVWLTSAGKGDFLRYRIRFAESVSGLSVGGVVKYRGVNVGSVESITIDPHDTMLISVDINVEKKTPIKTDTVASLKFQGVTGVVFIELTGGSNEAPLLKGAKGEDKVPEIKAKSSPLNEIVDRVPEILDRISHGIEQINKIMSDENVATFNATITKLSAEVDQLQPMIENGSKVAQNLNEITTSSKGSIKDTIENINRSSQQLDALMRDLSKTTRHISNLTQNLDEDPSRLIFPAKEKGVPTP